MDYSQILTLIGGIIGGGIGNELIRTFRDRKKDKATAEKAGEDARSVTLANNALEVAQIVGFTKTLNDFVEESKKHTEEIKKLNNRVSDVERDNAHLTSELKSKEAIIEYQKEERHEWTQSLMMVQEKYAESKLEIKTLKERILALEEVKEKETKLELREPK